MCGLTGAKAPGSSGSLPVSGQQPTQKLGTDCPDSVLANQYEGSHLQPTTSATLRGTPPGTSKRESDDSSLRMGGDTVHGAAGGPPSYGSVAATSLEEDGTTVCGTPTISMQRTEHGSMQQPAAAAAPIRPTSSMQPTEHGSMPLAALGGSMQQAATAAATIPPTSSMQLAVGGSMQQAVTAAGSGEQNLQLLADTRYRPFGPLYCIAQCWWTHVMMSHTARQRFKGMSLHSIALCTTVACRRFASAWQSHTLPKVLPQLSALLNPVCAVHGCFINS
jgi:hypothetical protein